MSSIRYNNMDGLLNVGVSDFLMADNELAACKNVWTYQLGKLQKVPGYTLAVNSQVINTEDVRYLHHYYDTTNSVNYLLAFSDEGTDLTLKYRTTGNFATISGISTSWDTYEGSYPCAVNYLGKTFIVGHKTGTTFLPNATVDGTTFSTVDEDISGMPQGKYIIRYRDLLYVLNARTGGASYPSRAYFCDEPKDGGIGWTGIATNFIEFGYDDGDEITGAVEALDRLIVFKHYSMWKYDESSRVQIAEVGCDSYRSIAKIKGVPYWTNRQGAWRWLGSQPELISARAQKFFDAVTQTTLGDQVASVYNEDEYRVFLGTVTMDGYTYTNSWFCFNTRTERCYIRCTHDIAKSACMYIESGVRRMYFGNNNGYVMKFATPVDAVFSDNGNQIDSFFVTKAYDYGIPEFKKFNNHVTIFSDYAVGMQCAIEKDNDGQFREENIPILRRNIEEMDLSADANRYRYKFYEKGLGKSWEFEGMVIQTDIIEEDK